MFDFVGQVLADFWLASAMDKMGFLLSLTGLLTLAAATAALFGARNSRALIDQLRRDASALAAERDAAEREARAARAHSEALDPDSWMERARQERADGNEELAIAALASGLGRVRTGLSRASLALAGYHLSQIVGPESLRHLDEGERFARLAVFLDPEDSDASFLLEEAELVRTRGQVEAVPTLAASFIPADPNELRSMINAINSKAQDFFETGTYRIALRLFMRSLLLAHRAGITREELGQLVQLKVCESLLLCGEYQQALDSLHALLEIQREMLPAADEELFRSHYLLANLKHHMGDHEAACRIVGDCIAAFLPAAGERHPYILVARAQEASFMALTDRPQESLDRCDSLLPHLADVYGADHANTLVTRHHRAYALTMLGRYDEALREIEALRPLQVSSLGADHPGTLITRKLEAEIVHDLGEPHRALELVTEVLRDLQRIEGPSHPHVLRAEELKNEILQALEEEQEPAGAAGGSTPA